MVMSNYKIYVRDKDLNKVAEIDDYNSLEMNMIFNAYGTWTMAIQSNTEVAYYLSQPKAGIIVVRNGVEIFSGPVDTKSRKWAIKSDVMTFSGFDDLVFLDNHLAYPVPNVAGTYNPAYDIRTGAAETIMKQYVDYNIGQNARTDRAINLKVDTDQGLGSTVKARARFDKLIDLNNTIALNGGGLGHKIIVSGGSLLYQVYQTTDKSNTVIFSPLFGNLLGFDYSEENPSANYIVAGGQGEGTSRVFVEQGDWNSISKYGKYEEFIDKRETSDTSEIINAINEELASKTSQTNLSISPIDTESIQFGRDYNLGDIVTVVITDPNIIVSEEEINNFLSLYQTSSESIQTVLQSSSPITIIKDVVRQVNIKLTKDGEIITPTVGTKETLRNSVAGIFQKIKSIGKRVSNLERV